MQQDARPLDPRTGRARTTSVRRSLTVAVTIVAVTACGSNEPRSPEAANSGSVGTLPAGGRSSDEADFEDCPFPTVRPAYLPWLEAREQVPVPRRDQSWGYASLQWIAPSGTPGWEAAEGRSRVRPYVVLRRHSSLGGSGPGKRVYATVAGIEGDLYEAETSGAGVIVWHISGGRCGELALELETDERLSQAEAERELRRIARSLRP
jgi:hypothetical protein